jgi:hypothetical protein
VRFVLLEVKLQFKVSDHRIRFCLMPLLLFFFANNLNLQFFPSRGSLSHTSGEF